LYRPIYAVKKAEPTELWVITGEENFKLTIGGTYADKIDLWNYPVDVGRFHMINVIPGDCADSNLDYSKLKVIYINLGNPDYNADECR
jgi:hypothetical protein